MGRHLAKTSALSRLVEGIRREPHDYRASLQTFPDLNIQRVASDLDLAFQGNKRGGRNEPAEFSSSFDSVEAAIIERVEAEQKAAHTSLLDELQIFSERLAGLDFEGRFSTIRQAAPEAVSNLRASAAQGRDELNRLRRNLRGFEQERDSFRRSHRLDRMARPSTGGGTMFKIGLLLMLFVIEVVVNGVFLSKGSELGLVGGVVEACTFAALNVGVSFAIGAVGARQMNHRNWLRKLVGLTSVLLYLAFAIGLNLALAHYREVAGSFVEDAGRQVVARIVVHPLGLADLKSWLFFAIGFAFSAIAFGDGVSFGDPYPGYGELERRLAQSHQIYIDRKGELIGVLEDIRDEASDVLEEANRDLSVRRGEHDTILEHRARLVRLFLAHQDQLERAANALLGLYREANVRARTAPPPARFGEAYKLPRIPVDQELVSNTIREDLRDSIAFSQELLAKHVEAIHAEFEKAVTGYHQIDDLLPETLHGATAASAA